MGKDFAAEVKLVQLACTAGWTAEKFIQAKLLGPLQFCLALLLAQIFTILTKKNPPPKVPPCKLLHEAGTILHRPSKIKNHEKKLMFSPP